MDTGKARNLLTRHYNALLTPNYALPLITIVATVIRLLPMRFKYLLGYDTTLHLAYIEYTLKHGWINFFPYGQGPNGMQMRLFHPLGLWMPPTYIYKLLQPFGVSLYNVFRATPVIFGVLTVIFTYFAVLQLYDKKEAFLSALFLSVSFGHIFRSMAGYYRGDNYMLFWYSVAFLGIALGATWKPRKWKYERFAFYIGSGLVAGLSSAFWSAYYPIFAFLLSSALTMSVGAFFLEKRQMFYDSTALVLSISAGTLLANSIGEHIGYGMAGYDHGLGKKLVAEFGLHFGAIKDAFLLLFLKYALPLTLLMIVALFIVSNYARKKKHRTVVVIAWILAGIIATLHYYPMIEHLVNSIFPHNPILETQKTSLRDLWLAYGVSLLPAAAFFVRKPDDRDFILFGPIVVSLSMVYIWGRFLFIGSLAVSVMAGVSLVRLAFLLRRVSIKGKAHIVAAVVLIAIPVLAAVQGTYNTLEVQPFLNERWESALVYLGNHSNLNDDVLTWWDQGRWVTYFAARAPVAQGSPSSFVAKYYLGQYQKWALMSRGVDYVIVSYDTVAKFGAVLATANVNPGDYFLMILPLKGQLWGSYVFTSGPYMILAKEADGSWKVTVDILGRSLAPEKAFIEEKSIEQVSNSEHSGIYAYVNLNYGYAVLMNGKAFNTTLSRLMFTEEYPKDYRLIYSDGGYIKIFQFVHPNVVVVAENGSIVLRFQNATGTGLEVFGYLDNGTLVFKKWYDVNGWDEFVLPENLNGSVVVRYTYIRNKTVLDRGVFRISDVLGN